MQEEEGRENSGSESQKENKVAQGKGSKREFPHDSEKCHRSTEIGKTHNKGMKTGGKFSKGDKEALSCQAQGMGEQGRKTKEKKIVNALLKLEVGALLKEITLNPAFSQLQFSQGEPGERRKSNEK